VKFGDRNLVTATLLDPDAPLEDLKNSILKSLPLSLVVQVSLFGSIASKTETFQSDIDLFVQVTNGDGKQQLELATEKLATLCLEKYGNVLSSYILTTEELKARSDLKLISNIQSGITLYPPKIIHES